MKIIISLPLVISTLERILSHVIRPLHTHIIPLTRSVHVLDTLTSISHTYSKRIHFPACRCTYAYTN